VTPSHEPDPAAWFEPYIDSMDSWSDHAKLPVLQPFDMTMIDRFSSFRAEMANLETIYDSLPKTSETVSADNHQEVIAIFCARMRRLFFPGFNISNHFIQSNILLGPQRSIAGLTQKLDVAYLPLQIIDQPVIIMQTGGATGRTIFILLNNLPIPMVDKDRLRARTIQLMQRYFTWEFKEDDLNVMSNGDNYMVTVNSNHKTGTIYDDIHAQFSTHYICVSFPQYGPSDLQPATQPDPASWFETLN
jgi:hypothetical protein